MKIEQHFDKIASFQNLELLANQVVEGFISGMHKSFTDSPPNLLSIKSIIRAKAPKISIGNSLPEQIAYIQSDLKKKLT
jgi:hypothetical protein